MFHHLDFPRLFLCESTGYSKHKTTGIASVAICGGSNHILTGLINVQPNTDIFSYLAKDFRENKNLTCRKYTTQSCQSLHTSYQETPNILLIQINRPRFSVSYLHGRPQKNNYPFGIENIKL